ncbi:hypothetical protein GJ496_011947 [Pomphorhynchus laevis]|nr:hypothetical protein GJ496_011947 [Pomphorhynchus laevis]
MTTPTAITKAIVSPLPRNFSESQFLQWLDPLPKHNYFWYYQPSSQSFSEMLHSFVCINFESIEDMLSFSTYLSTKELPTDSLLDFKSRPECKIAINQMICTDKRRSLKDIYEDNTGELTTTAFLNDDIFKCDELSNNSNSDLECDEVFKEYLEFIDVRDNELINTSDDDLGNDDDECSVDDLDGEDIDQEDDIEGDKEDGSSDEAENNGGREENKNRKKHNASADESEPRSDNESSDDAMTGTNRIQTATSTDTTVIAAAKMAIEEDFAGTETRLTELLESSAATNSTDNRIRPRSSSLQHAKFASSSSLYATTEMTKSMDAIHKFGKHLSSQTLQSVDHLAGSAERFKLRQPIIAMTTKASIKVNSVARKKNDVILNSNDNKYYQHTSEEKNNGHQLTDFKATMSVAEEIPPIVDTNNDDNPKQYADDGDDESLTKMFNENEDGYQSSTSLSSYSPPLVPADAKSTVRRRPKWSQPYQPPKIRCSDNALQTSSIQEKDYDRRPYSSRNNRKLMLYSKDNGSGSDVGEHTKKQHDSHHSKDNDILSNNDSQQNQELLQQDVKFRKSSLYTTGNQRNTWNDNSVSNNFGGFVERGKHQTLVNKSSAERRHHEPKYESTRYYSSRYESSKYDNGVNSPKYDYIPQHRQRRGDFRNDSSKFDNGKYDQRRTSRYFDDYHHQGASRRSRREPSNSGNYYPRGSSNDSQPKKTTFNKNVTSSMGVAVMVSEACRQSSYNNGDDEDKNVSVNQENNRSFIELQSFEEHPRRRRRQPHHQYTNNKYDELTEENRTIAGSAAGNGISNNSSNIRYDNRRQYPSSLSMTSSKFAMNDEGKYYNSKQKFKFETTTVMTSNANNRKQYCDKYSQPSTTVKQHPRFDEGISNNDDDNGDDGVAIGKHIFDKRFKTKYETNDCIVNGDSNVCDLNSNNTRSCVVDRYSLRHQNNHKQSYHRKDNDNYHRNHINNRISYESNQDVRSQSRGRNDGGDDHHNNNVIENHIKDVLGMQHQKSQRPVTTNRRKPNNNSSSYHRQHNNYYRDDDYNRRNDNTDQTYGVNEVRSPLSSSRHLISDINHSSGMMSTTGSGNIRRGGGGNGSVFPVRDASNAQKLNRNKIVRSYWGPTDDWD